MKKYIMTALRGFSACLLASLIPFGVIVGIVILFLIHTLPAWGAIGAFVFVVAFEAALALLSWAIGEYLEEDYYE